jgi:hypothetical protein
MKYLDQAVSFFKSHPIMILMGAAFISGAWFYPYYYKKKRPIFQS